MNQCIYCQQFTFKSAECDSRSEQHAKEMERNGFGRCKYAKFGVFASAVKPIQCDRFLAAQNMDVRERWVSKYG